MSHRTYYFLLNPRSGTALSLGLNSVKLKDQLDTLGYDAIVDADDEAPFNERIEKARTSECEVVVAAGGDGTASALASALAGTDKILTIMPLGTVNSLAKDLSVPLDIDDWLASLAAMEPRRIDVGEVNGKLFLHMAVVGLIPAMAAGREMLRDRTGFGAKVGLLRYFLRRLSRTRRLAVQIDPANEPARIERVQSLAVACNAYGEGFGKFLARDTLDSGELTLYLIKRLALFDLARLGLEMLLGRWQEDKAIDIQSVPAVTIHSHKPRLQVMLDGEIQSLEEPLKFKIRPRALHVLAPPPEGEKNIDSESNASAKGA